MTSVIIPAKDVGKVIFEDLLEFAIEQYGPEGEELLAEFLQFWSETY
jgi:hypothetical protein